MLQVNLGILHSTKNIHFEIYYIS